MEATSPTKRRVLGSLDPNASPRPRLDAKQAANAPSSPLKRVTVFSASPSQQEPAKRPLLFGEMSADLLHPAKKVCQEDSRRDMASDKISRAPMLQEANHNAQVCKLVLPPSQFLNPLTGLVSLSPVPPPRDGNPRRPSHRHSSTLPP